MLEARTSVYAVQTLFGEKYIISSYMEELLGSGEITDKYIPMRVFPRKIHGRWKKQAERLFPGYLFIETPDPGTLFFRMKKSPNLSRLLADRESVERHFV